MRLVIVESPRKIKKVKSYLGEGFDVEATIGHFCDLPPRELGVDIATMIPTYVIDEKKSDVVERLKTKASKAEEILIATDPDREGEAIGWHVIRALTLGDKVKRIEFNAITKQAIQKALANPRQINHHLVDAQQARRVLDRLVGYKVSPLLRSFGNGLSAGRVQTATLHLVCQRERDRRKFKSKPYWTIKVSYAGGLISELCDGDGKVIRPKKEPEAQQAAEQAKQSPHEVVSIERKEDQKKAPAPFTTSTMQQVAGARLGLDPKVTMQVAQKLYEECLITYHRSDCPNLSEDGIKLAREWIQANHPASLPDKPPTYKAKAGAQEAHEAIRPNSLDQVELEGDQKALYELIRDRFLASQMKPALLAKTTVITKTPGELFFVARGSEVLEPHWLSINADAETDEEENDDESQIPTVVEGQNLEVSEVQSDKKMTQPPSRFTKGNLVKEMEKLGIGRPSTWAAILDVLSKREYVQEEKKAVMPTGLGMRVDDMMLEGLPELTSHQYTADMEEKLDVIASGDLQWQKYLMDWWSGDFKLKVAKAANTWAQIVEGLHKKAENGDEQAARAIGLDPNAPDCPKCGKKMKAVRSNGSEFWGCTGYPDCKTSKPIAAKTKDGKEIICSKCGNPMVEKEGQNGPFLACSGWPKCKRTAPIEVITGQIKKCKKCGKPMTKREGSKGEFWGCTGYPKCKNTKPVTKKQKK